MKLRLFTTYSDGALMRRVSNGDHDAFTLLYKRYADKLYSYFVKMLWKNSELAADKTQQVFLAVWEKSNSFDQEKNFRTWLFSMAHNICKNEYRYYEHKTFTSTEPYIETLQAQAYNAETQMNDKMIKQYLDSLLDTLDPETKNIFLLRYYEELSVKEIAVLTALPEGTVRSRIFYSLKRMKIPSNF